MIGKSCEEMRDLLVDYVDRELSEQDFQAVAEHLAGCPACRETVKGLERSLDLAKAIWLDNLQGGERVAASVTRRGPVMRWLAVAAVVSVAVGGALFLNTFRKWPPATVTYAQIEQQVTRAAAAARLLAATQILAKCEGTQSIVEQQARYILSHYGDTAAASELKATMSSLLKGATYD
jgi:anti-sigma factor RsiW